MSGWARLPYGAVDGPALWRRDYGGRLWATYIDEMIRCLDVVNDAGGSTESILEEWCEGDEMDRERLDEVAAAYVTLRALALVLALAMPTNNDEGDQR